MNFFKDSDFEGHYLDQCKTFAQWAAYFANNKLEQMGEEVFGIEGEVWGEMHNGQGFTAMEFNKRPATHSALLINIEPIEKCTHPVENVCWSGDHTGQTYLCSNCGAKLKPKTFEVVG